MSVNKVTLLGNCCADPKVTVFPDGGKVAQLTLATNKRAYKTKDGRDVPEKAEFHNIVLQRTNLAEVAEKYVKKGDKLYLEGELRTRKYTDSNGIDRYVTEIYVDVMELLSARKDSAPAPMPESHQQDPAVGGPLPW